MGRTRECISCHQVKKINGRGLCGACYTREYDAGTIKNFPKANAKFIPKEAICLDCHEFKRIYGQGRCRTCHPKWYREQPGVRERHAEVERQRRERLGVTYKEYERQRNVKRREGRLAYNKEYYKNNSDTLKDYQKQYRQENKDKMLVLWRRTYARRKNAEGELTKEQWTLLVGFYCPDNKCLCCKLEFDRGDKAKKLSIDHVLPLSKGGTHWPENIQPLCMTCNNAKKTKLIDYRPDAGYYAKSLGECSAENINGA